MSIIAALISVVVITSVGFAKRAGSKTATPRGGDQPQAPFFMSGSNQESLASVGTRVEVAPVKPKHFRGDIRTLPLDKPKVKKPRREPKEPEGELERAGADAALQPFAPEVAAPAPSASFAGLDFTNSEQRQTRHL